MKRKPTTPEKILAQMREQLLQEESPFWTRKEFLFSISLILVLVLSLGTAYDVASAFRAVTTGSNRFNILTSNSLPPVKIELVRSMSLDGKEAFERALQVRAERAAQYGALLKNARYSLTPGLFARVDPKLKWLSNADFYLRTPLTSKQRSSLQSNGALLQPIAARTILNPLLLVRPLFFGLSERGNKNFQWTCPFDEVDAKNAFVPRELSLTYDLARKTAVAQFDLSTFISHISECLQTPQKTEAIEFGLSAVNALDFGFQFLGLDSTETQGVTPKEPFSVTLLSEYFGSAPTPLDKRESKNSFNLTRKWVPRLQISSLPSQATLALWLDEPSSTADPDFKYRLEFR